MALKIKVAGTWRDALPKVKVAGTWRGVSQAYVKVAGEWKALLQTINGFTFNFLRTPSLSTNGTVELHDSSGNVYFSFPVNDQMVLDGVNTPLTYQAQFEDTILIYTVATSNKSPNYTRIGVRQYTLAGNEILSATYFDSTFRPTILASTQAILKTSTGFTLGSLDSHTLIKVNSSLSTITLEPISTLNDTNFVSRPVWIDPTNDDIYFYYTPESGLNTTATLYRYDGSTLFSLFSITSDFEYDRLYFRYDDTTELFYVAHFKGINGFLGDTVECKIYSVNKGGSAVLFVAVHDYILPEDSDFASSPITGYGYLTITQDNIYTLEQTRTDSNYILKFSRASGYVGRINTIDLYSGTTRPLNLMDSVDDTVLLRRPFVSGDTNIIFVVVKAGDDTTVYEKDYNDLNNNVGISQENRTILPHLGFTT